MVMNIIAGIVSYFICAISPAIIICKLVKGKDIRSFGSKNAGTTNAIRVMGKFWGGLTFILDILKSFLAYLIIILIGNILKLDIDVSVKSFYLISSVIGHCYPVYYGFKGGKGVATTIATMIVIDSEITAVILITSAIIILVTRMISVGSISGIILLFVMTFVMLPEYIIAVFIISTIVIFKHKDNIKRLLKNEEHKLF